MRKGAIAAMLGALAAAAVALPASAHHELPEETGGVLSELSGYASPPDIGSPLDERSPNMTLIGNFDDGGVYRQGSDEAFWGHTAILGAFDNPSGFRLVDISDPTRPSEIGQFVCPGSQADVSVWEDLVFLSVDSPRGDADPSTDNAQCGMGGAPAPLAAASEAWEGIRVVDTSDPTNPQQIAAPYTDCGSHTNTLVPDLANGRVLVYALSYPLNPQGVKCSPVTHRKFSVVEVPLASPEDAKVISTPDVSPAIGCHDVTVYPAIDLAAAACITESQLWDISDPANPEVISHITNPRIQIHHSTTLNWEGTTAVIGDEMTGATVTPGCPEGADEHTPLGALWFYDISDRANPIEKGSFHIPQSQSDSLICTAHNFNTVPLRNDRDVLVSGWYNGGTTVVDFSDPSAPAQLGYYIAKGPTQSSGTEARPDQTIRSTSWSSYFYNGFIYTNNFDEDINSLSPQSRGLDVFHISDRLFRRAATLNYLNPQTMEPFPGQR
jgi:hypothetical protein